VSIKNQLNEYNLKPNKRLGQSFLINKKVLQKIIKTANISKNETVLEIGPGLGVLTKELAEEARKVIAIEKDKQMADALKEILKDYKNVEIIVGDILEILRGRALKHTTFAKIVCFKARPLDYKVVANIPYYLTSPLIRKFLESANPPKEMILLVQKEVAQRICAKPPKMNLLATSVQFYAKPKIISYVSKSSFWPEPKVDSAIIKIITKNSPPDSKRFFQIVKAGFSHPRKQLANNLSKELNIEKEKIKKALAECNLNIQARAQNLSVKDWKSLMFKSHFPGENP